MQRHFSDFVNSHGPVDRHLYEAAERFLNELLLNIYGQAAAGSIKSAPMPIKLIDRPEVAKLVLKSTDQFYKNYDFLELIGKGRFSANGEEWRIRAALTQRYYAGVLNQIEHGHLVNIYSTHLKQCSKSYGLMDALVGAAVEIFSLALGFSKPLFWPPEIVDQIRLKLCLRQAMEWVPGPAKWHTQISEECRADTSILESVWRQDRQVNAWLDSLSKQIPADYNFNPVHELIQNIFAATETTASSLCWMADILSRDLFWFEYLSEAQEDTTGGAWTHFMNESLRLFAPVPMVTRVSARNQTIAGESFKENEPLLVSIVGLHCNASDWQMPFRFWPQRPEWVQNEQPQSFIPFLIGPRVCGGRKLALAELRAGLAAMLNTVRFKPATAPVALKYGLTSRPWVQPEIELHEN